MELSVKNIAVLIDVSSIYSRYNLFNRAGTFISSGNEMVKKKLSNYNTNAG